MLRFVPIPEELKQKLENKADNEHYDSFGFTLTQPLASYSGFKDEPDHLFVLFKLDGDMIYIIAAHNKGDAHFTPARYDIVIPELIYELDQLCPSRQKYNLAQMDEDLVAKLRECEWDEDVAKLGFRCNGRLQEHPGFDNFFERLWVWYKVVEHEVYIAITVDGGNTSCHMVYYDMYVPDIIEKVIEADPSGQ